MKKMEKTQIEKNAIYTLVVGLGVTGLSVVRYLRRLGERVVVVDSRDLPPGMNELKEKYPDVELYTGKFKSALFTSARRIVVSPGVSMSEPALKKAKEQGVEIAGDIDLFAHEVTAPVVGITGSNGKSTVTTLLAEMAKCAGIDVAIGGNIGTPVLEIVDDNYELYVLELSSFQLDTLQSLPMEVAVVLNISPDHMDRYDDLNSYVMSKHEIYRNAKTCVVNRDDELAGNQTFACAHTVGFSLKQPGNNDFGLCEYEGVSWLCRGTERVLSVDEIKVKGAHNIANVLAALALGTVLTIPDRFMVEAIKNFSGLEHRTQWVIEKHGVNWFNDSKGTNVGASIAAIEGLPGKHVLIAGGDGKGADFSPLATVAAQHLRAVVLIGRDAEKIGAVLNGLVPVVYAADMDEAVIKAANLAQAGDNVLLSPACASFDMYRNFEHRGQVFMEAVREHVR
ncbi:MAG: UDP-N-acetylmuramoyl-L-alanine--D-glutamate ligase [Gammaproteobacteria bacterium]|nr:UDP-N-acetylmuramoyl-L-alanine--D-glutamate ligase [Gammaproteobacteria bacterium]